MEIMMLALVGRQPLSGDWRAQGRRRHLTLLLHFPRTVPLWAVLTGLLTSVLVGLLAGMYPATRAARLNLVVAIRGV